MAMSVQDLVQEAKKQIREIDPDTAEQHLGEPQTVVIDVREPAESRQAGCPGPSTSRAASWSSASGSAPSWRTPRSPCSSTAGAGRVRR